MRSRRLACVLPLALLAAGCATPGVGFRCPARGGPDWRELASEHFVLRTDLPRPEAAALLGRLERMRAAVSAALFADAPAVAGRVEVIAFRSVEEYRPFAPAGATGYYLRYAGGPPRVVLTGDVTPSQRGLLAHELTHHFLSGVFKRQPRWFAEGLAVYLESLGEAEGRRVRVGAPPATRLGRARSSRVPLQELLAWDGSAEGATALDRYATSWLLVHWLIHRQPAAFERLQRSFAAGEPPADAWRAALPAYDPGAGGSLEALEGVLAAYARELGGGAGREIEIAARTAYSEQAIPAAEVHAIRLALWGHGPPRPRGELETEVDEALEESPEHPVALQALAALRGADAEPLARRAAAAHPDDPRAWTFLGGALRGEHAAREREAAYRRAAALAPGNPAALHNLAQELLAQGRSGEALPLARHAARLAPWSPPLLSGYAAVLSDLGRCADAVAVQQQALDALPERTRAEARRALLARLERYATQCRDPAPSGRGAAR